MNKVLIVTAPCMIDFGITLAVLVGSWLSSEAMAVLPVGAALFLRSEFSKLVGLVRPTETSA